jgi:hypothetical protein
MEVSMQRLVGALAASVLLVTPIAASAQSHDGHGTGGGGGHGFSSHSFSTGGGHGFRGGFDRDHDFRGGFIPFFGGFGLGLASPWYYGWGPYWDDPYGPWGDGDYDYYGWGPPPPPPAPGAGPPPPACGSWNWRSDLNRYVWVPASCAAPTAPPE